METDEVKVCGNDLLKQSLVVTRATSTSYQGVLHVYFTRLCPAS
ncbi:hypothetical protein V6Z11_D13G110400 [Gossypium hirsutum]